MEVGANEDTKDSKHSRTALDVAKMSGHLVVYKRAAMEPTAQRVLTLMSASLENKKDHHRVEKTNTKNNMTQGDVNAEGDDAKTTTPVHKIAFLKHIFWRIWSYIIPTY